MWEQVEHAVGEVFREARTPDLRALSSENLDRLGSAAKEAHEDVGGRILEKGEEQRQAADGGDWIRFQACRDDVHRLHEEWRGLGEEISRIEEARRHKHLEERVNERLGGHTRAMLLEASVLVLIVAVLGMLLWEVLFAAEASPRLLLTLALVDTCICVFFLWEFFWRMSLADSKSWYFKRHWMDFVSSLPFALLNADVLRIGRLARVMRVARAARLARALRLLRALRAMAFVFRGFEKVGQSFNIRVLNRPLAATLVFLVLGGMLMASMEPDAFRQQEEGSAVPDGIWWSFTTVCTGGFADIYNPQGWPGRVLTVVLVIMGALLTGAFTAALASVLLGDDTERIERKLAAVLERIEGPPKQ